MLGNMMDLPLQISSLLDHAEQTHPDTEIVSRRCEGDIHRYTMSDAAKRAKQAANALEKMGVQQGDRVATLAWNNYRHYELYFAVSGTGAVMHTINPRLFPEQLVYIINHAEDRWIFVDLTFVPLLEAIKDQITNVEGFIVLCDEDRMPETSLPNAICYETLIKNEPETYSWPLLDEQQAACLCYTSGTTGNPKGVLYSHRSTMIHTMGSIGYEAIGISSLTCALPVVPMFHVNAWSIPYAATMTGAKLVFPGAGMDGASLWELIESEQPDLLLGVPTVWLMLLNHMEAIGKKLESVQNVIVGGSAAPLSMIKKFQEGHDAFLIHAWGMTEMSPIGTINCQTRAMMEMPLEERYALQQSVGRPIYGVQMKIVDDENNEMPRDGVARGRLLVRGPWIVQSYYKSDDTSNWHDGWFDTGDVATIDSKNYLRIVDRSKDVIKSGGEWISSIDLENAAVGHQAVAEACVIGVAHPKWDERPLLLVVKNEGAEVSKSEILEYLTDKVAKWWLPDDVVFVSELPHTATGKLLKVNLRTEYADYLLNKAAEAEPA
ncbi:3-(methylthio)propionyl-CoA ligase [Parendozoicomonas haliclonae]|uniref:Long-chain-fatty-acid-CoA ligase n=1 Tax=Parendozoicomonas haliclonae TaxID=1960125 RepID=A0A1X7AH20_9GAMM|nr:3-(methylthio)propionyl-CoA ligase [Parendozoicomonas haliclonae]SMA40052.1 Long-chain-fatty-acid-CoA ligase [Parendozoicomonas haliclonae]